MISTETIVSCLSVIAAIISAIYAWQSSKYTKENMQLTNALTLELKLMEAKKEWDNSIKETAVVLAKEVDTINHEVIIALQIYNKCTLENYLNIFERLCFFLLNKTFEDAHYKTQYRNMLNDTIKSLSTDGNPFFNIAATPYKKMLELNNKWQNS